MPRRVRGMGAFDPETLEAQLALGITTFIAAVDGPEYSAAGIRELVAWRDSVSARA